MGTLDKVRGALGVDVQRRSLESSRHYRSAASREREERESGRSGEALRRKLQRSNLAADLIEYFSGNGRNLTPLQVRVGLALMDKAYPDLKAVEVDATLTDGTSRADLEERMAAAGIDIEGVWSRIE